MAKYLIINADDFGYNKQQNEAITDLLRRGCLPSVSVMTVAPRADECGVLAPFPASVGVHLTINSDSAREKWHSLTGSASLGGAEGLPAKQSELTVHAKHKDVAAELEAQYRFLTDRGVTPDHADNHCGTLYGVNGRRFYMDAFEFCRKYSLPFRFPKTAGFLERQVGRTLPSVVKAVQGAIVRQGEKRGVEMPDDLVSNPWSMERIKDYDTLRKYYMDAVDACINGVTEMFMHPAFPVDDTPGEWPKRVFEYELLRSGDLLQRAKEKDVQVVTWKIFKEISEAKK